MLIERPYAERVRDAFAHLGMDNVGVEEFEMLRHGRHFRLSESTKAIVGHDQEENDWLAQNAGQRLRLDPAAAMGPTALVEGTPVDHELMLAARLMARYCDHREGESVRLIVSRPGKTSQEIEALPLSADDPRIAAWRIGG